MIGKLRDLDKPAIRKCMIISQEAQLTVDSYSELVLQLVKHSLWGSMVAWKHFGIYPDVGIRVG